MDSLIALGLIEIFRDSSPWSWLPPWDTALQRFEDATPLDIGVVLLITGAIAAGFVIHRDWVKRKGFRMVLKDRNDKIHAHWLEIIQEGVDSLLLAGKISRKEADKMFADAAKKMGLLDLVPKKRMLRMVKEDLKRIRAKRIRDGGDKHPTIPGGPPTPIVRQKFAERLGKAAKFWQKDAA